ncbi:MAG: hypothetical protein ABR534_03340 [Desulfotignum sp.]|nr:hypothetical protein [Desulfobacteraceae bacterium]
MKKKNGKNQEFFLQNRIVILYIPVRQDSHMMAAIKLHGSVLLQDALYVGNNTHALAGTTKHESC